MKVLGIDTAASHVAGAVLASGETLSRGAAPGGRQGARRLAEILDEVLDRAGIAPAELDGIAAGIGPGPFTALRVGLGAAAGLALAVGCAVWGVPTASAWRAGARPGHGTVLPVIDAGRGELWIPGPEGEPGRLVTPDELAALDPGGRLVGSGALRYRDRLAELLGPARILDLDPVTAAIGAAREGARKGRAGSTSSLRPLYARPPDAVPPRRTP